MTIEKQNVFLLSLVDRLYLELGAYRAFLEWTKNLAEGEDIAGILTKCRRDPALRPHVDATLKDLAAKLTETDELDPDRVSRELLERWTPKGRVNWGWRLSFMGSAVSMAIEFPTLVVRG